MSWIADIAGKAESLLNQIDQSTATALQKSRSSPTSRGGQIFSSSQANLDAVVTKRFTDEMTYSNLNASTSGGHSRRQNRSGYASSVSSAPAKVPSDRDEKLINFLNEPVITAPATTGTSTQHSRRSSSSSIHSLPFAATAERFGESTVAQQAVGMMDTIENYEKLTDVSTPYSIGRHRPTPVGRGTVAEFLAHEADLQKALQAKDSQLAVLRVRLQDTDQQLQIKSQRLLKLEREQEKLFKDSLETSSNKTQAFGNLEKKLEEAEYELERERSASKRLENEFLARIQRLEHEQSDLLQQLTAVQKSLTEEKIKCGEFGEQLKLAKYNLESNKLEFDEYKQKATRILQSKEKLIATLKHEDAGSTTADNTALLVQLEEVRTERDLLKEDLQQAHLQLYNLRGETQELESQLIQEQRSSLEQQRYLQDQCQTYQQSSTQYREQYEQLKQDYQYVQDEMRRQHAMLQSKLREKDSEITRLLAQVSQRPVRDTQNSELESRIRQLTVNLIQKQAVIEALQTDKQTLSLQLERTEKSYREAESAAIRASSSTFIDMSNSDEGSHSRIPQFFRESPSDTGVARSVKKAYSSVEKFNVRFGLFLRRYPVARLFLVAYAVLLHLWVMVVLLTYTPEMHSADFQTASRSSDGRLPGVIP